MSIRENRIGESRMMRCGLRATIIEYRSSEDIDIQFEDGKIVKNKGYYKFKKGNIPYSFMGAYGNRIGEKRMMNCGKEGTIIKYRNSTDIDVQFEDGLIAKNKTYGNFVKGRVNPPLSRVGEKKVMHCGLEAEIIEYVNTQDITIRFSNGEIVEHTRYNQFKKGTVALKEKFDRTGETRVMNCGMKATIINYRNSCDIDIQFEDGTIVEKRMYGSFKSGQIRNPNLFKKYKPRKKEKKTIVKARKAHENDVIARTGETATMKCGMEAKIIDYRGAQDMDVRFEDGTVVKNVSYGRFKKGTIANPNRHIRVGEKRMLKCGMEAEIIDYRSSEDIDIRFPDGAILKNVAYGNFVRGTLKHPNLYALQRIGRKKMMKCGMMAEVIDCKTSRDAVIRFEDGTIVNNVTYSDFENGRVSYPIAKKKIGMKRLMSCGMEATIIAYRTAEDIDIQFADGKIAEHKRFKHFDTGKIAYPVERIGEVRTMKCGLQAEIIAYRKANDIDVKFENGVIRKHAQYSAFCEGTISGIPNEKSKES